MFKRPSTIGSMKHHDTRLPLESARLVPSSSYRTPAASGLAAALLLTFVFLSSHHLHLPILTAQGTPAAPVSPSNLDTPSLSSTLLYAASYAGAVATLNLTWHTQGGGPAPDAYSLDVLATSDGCKPSPSWLTVDYANSVLYCTDEGLSSDHGSVSAFNIAGDGSLTLLDRVNVVSGPVSAVLYGDRSRGLAVAQYGGSSMTWLDSLEHTGLSLLDSRSFQLAEPGPVPSRQEAPHPHQVSLDPTGQFVLVPDLGADLVRVFHVDGTSLSLTEVEPLVATPGSGPRHVDFLVTPDGGTYMYLIAELTNTITGYRVSYPTAQSMSFDRFFQCPTHGAGNVVPKGASASEITVSPDGRFLTISSRDEKSFSIPKPGSRPDQDSEVIDSDSLITFAIDPLDGRLSFLQKFPAGGMIPRHFSINRAGTLAAVALQRDGRVVIVSRDVETGQMKEILASTSIEGEVTAVIFAE